MNKTYQIIVDAVSRGMYVSEEGKVIGISGKELAIRKRGKQKYPTISVTTELTKSGRYGIPAHQLAAYCFYGEKMFDPGLVVRHLNGNVLDLSKINIVLGTHSENNLDKPKNIRVEAARKARLSQGLFPKNSKFNEEQVREARNLHKDGHTVSELVDKYGVSKTTIKDLLRKKTYSWII